jgi:type IV secretion system protein VirD4
VPVLIILDEFARLGRAQVIAGAFSFVAGYGLWLLLVLQSPSQLRAEYGPDVAEDIMANCGVEICFAPKEIRLARELSERLGDWTYKGRSTSRPSGFSAGRSSQTQSDQRRRLLLPQELILQPPGTLIVLRAGSPPIRGAKIIYYREKAFKHRLLPAPSVPAHPLPKPPVFPARAAADDDLRMRPRSKAEAPDDIERDAKVWAERALAARVKPRGRSDAKTGR